MNPEEKTCSICLGSLGAGQGQAIFTAECAHSFHFSCIGSSVTHGNRDCPICRAPWNNLPFMMPAAYPSIVGLIPDHVVANDGLQMPVFAPEPLVFSDDEPLPNAGDPAASSASAVRLLQGVSIRAVPERQAVAASESIPHFTVLIRLKAPSLSDDAWHTQRAPIDLVTVLDVSGSMTGSKLALLKRAVNFVIDNLGPLDRLSVVSFSTTARRIFPLRRMVEGGREDAKRAVNLLSANGLTNIVEGLVKGVQVLEERRWQNPVATIIFLSDGCDTCHHNSRNQTLLGSRQAPPYLQRLPASIRPSNGGTNDQGHGAIFPVHSFGFGSDHDPLVMHDISDSSGGTFSFIESYEIVQDAFASCIGGLLSVVAQELYVTVRSASHGVEIKSIPSGRYSSEITDNGSQGMITVGDLYADEEKEFLVHLSVPMHTNAGEGEQKTSLLDITCSYRDAVLKETVQIDTDLVEIRRPDALLPPDTAVNLEVDRQITRLRATASMTEAQLLADTGDLSSAQALLSGARSAVLASPAGQAGDELCMSLEAEMKEIEARMQNVGVYNQSGRAYTRSSISSHGYQRATIRGRRVSAPDRGPGGEGSPAAAPSPSFVAYATPQMARMVRKSQQLDNDLM